MPTLLEIKTPEASAELCQSLGLDFVELNMNLPEIQADNIDISRLRGISDKYGVYFTFHLDENLNPGDFNGMVAKAYTDTMLFTIEAAKRLSSPILNMHLASGVYFMLPDKKIYLFDEYEAEYLKKMTEFRDKCASAIGNSGIKICLENADGFHSVAALKKALDLLLESDAFALTFDIGHNAFFGGEQEPVILARSDRLAHFHIHDNLIKPHLPLGEGDIDIVKYLEMAKKYDCRSVIEIKNSDGLRRSVDWLREKNYL